MLSRAIEGADGGHVAGFSVIHAASELRRDHVLGALALDGTPYQLLVGQRSVELRGVDEVDTELEGALDRRGRFLLVGRAVERGHTHAAETDRGDVERSKVSMLHFLP